MGDENNPNSPFYDDPKDNNIRVEDQGDLITKFLYEPNHRRYDKDEYFNFINKNDVLTHTTDEEAVLIRPQMENIIILNRHVEKKKMWVESGEYEKIGEDGEKVIVRPILIEKEVDVDRFSISIRNCKTFIRAITVTAAGRNGMFIKDSKTVRLEKDQTIEDKTQTQPGFWSKIKKK